MMRPRPRRVPLPWPPVSRTARLRALAAAGLATGLLVVTASACSQRAGTAATGTAVQASTTTTFAPSTELLDAGHEPRRPLRFRLAARSWTLVVTSDVDVSQDGDAGPVALDLPAVDQRVRLTTTPTSANSADLEVVFEAVTAVPSPSLPEAERRALDTRLARLVGLRGKGRIDTRGRLVAMSYETPRGLDEDMRALVATLPAQLARLVAPVPDEAVGVGARWRSSSSVDLGGTTVPIRTVYELTDIDGDVVSYSSTSEGSVRDRELNLPGAPAGTTFHLRELRSSGRGVGTFSLHSFEVTADVSSSTTQEMTVTDPRGPVTVDQRTETHVVVAPGT